MQKRKSFLANIDAKTIDFNEVKKRLEDKINRINNYKHTNYSEDSKPPASEKNAEKNIENNPLLKDSSEDTSEDMSSTENTTFAKKTSSTGRTTTAKNTQPSERTRATARATYSPINFQENIVSNIQNNPTVEDNITQENTTYSKTSSYAYSEENVGESNNLPTSSPQTLYKDAPQESHETAQNTNKPSSIIENNTVESNHTKEYVEKIVVMKEPQIPIKNTSPTTKSTTQQNIFKNKSLPENNLSSADVLTSLQKIKESHEEIIAQIKDIKQDTLDENTFLIEDIYHLLQEINKNLISHTEQTHTEQAYTETHTEQEDIPEDSTLQEVSHTDILASLQNVEESHEEIIAQIKDIKQDTLDENTLLIEDIYHLLKEVNDRNELINHLYTTIAENSKENQSKNKETDTEFVKQSSEDIKDENTSNEDTSNEDTSKKAIKNIPLAIENKSKYLRISESIANRLNIEKKTSPNTEETPLSQESKSIVPFNIIPINNTIGSPSVAEIKNINANKQQVSENIALNNDILKYLQEEQSKTHTLLNNLLEISSKDKEQIIQCIVDISPKISTIYEAIKLSHQELQNNTAKIKANIKFFAEQASQDTDMRYQSLSTKMDTISMDTTIDLLYYSEAIGNNVKEIQHKLNTILKHNDNFSKKVEEELAEQDYMTSKMSTELNNISTNQNKTLGLMQSFNKELSNNVANNFDNTNLTNQFIEFANNSLNNIDDIRGNIESLKKQLETQSLNHSNEISNLNTHLAYLQDIQKKFIGTFNARGSQLIEYNQNLSSHLKNLDFDAINKVSEKVDTVLNLVTHKELQNISTNKNSHNIQNHNIHRDDKSKKVDIPTNMKYLQQEISKKIDKED